jgi:hypothetical protein
MSTEIKLFRDLGQGKEQKVLFVHFELANASETGCSRIPELQEENVWASNMYEQLMIPSLQIHILQQLWKDGA